MNVRELSTKVFLAHLRRHPMPEIMNEDCDAALTSILKEYGDTITHVTMFEVRLGEDSQYFDLSMSIEHDDIPFVEALWYEIDYDEFKKAYETGNKIIPCLFANIDFKMDDKAKWDKLLPAFLGEERAKRLRPAFDRVLERLPEGAYPKQVGTMTSRGEIDIMRLVIMFPDWDSIPEGLVNIGWQGDPVALRNAFEPWRHIEQVAVNIDLSESGVLSKIGMEAFSRWRHPMLVDKVIARLEDAGLCLPSKGEALRRWIRFRPDGDPFIQTLISHFKLNYKDGKITEAKAYLEQVPYIHHRYFDAYDRPLYLQIMLKDKKNTLSIDAAIKWLCECEANRVHEVRLMGDVSEYEHLERILAECKRCNESEAGEIRAVVELGRKVSPAWLEKMIAAGVYGFIIDINAEGTDGAAVWILKILRDKGFGNVRVKWFMHRNNAEKISKVIRLAEKLNVKELIVTGMKPTKDRQVPTREQIIHASETIKKWRTEHQKTDDRTENNDVPAALNDDMELSVESCFSPLRAFMEGSDPKKNGNRGIERGCTAGCDHFCVLPSGKVTPCVYLDCEEDVSSLAAYWDESPTLKKIRNDSIRTKSCEACAYKRRCLPCPTISSCPIVSE